MARARALGLDPATRPTASTKRRPTEGFLVGETISLPSSWWLLLLPLDLLPWSMWLPAGREEKELDDDEDNENADAGAAEGGRELEVFVEELPKRLRAPSDRPPLLGEGAPRSKRFDRPLPPPLPPLLLPFAGESTAGEGAAARWGLLDMRPATRCMSHRVGDIPGARPRGDGRPARLAPASPPSPPRAAPVPAEDLEARSAAAPVRKSTAPPPPPPAISLPLLLPPCSELRLKPGGADVGRPVRALGFTGTGLGFALGFGTPNPEAMPLLPKPLLPWWLCPICASCFNSSLKLFDRLLPIKRPGPRLPPPTTLPAGSAALSSSIDSKIRLDPFMPPGEPPELLPVFAFLRAYIDCFIKSSPACEFPLPTMMPRSMSYDIRGFAATPPLLLLW